MAGQKWPSTTPGTTEAQSLYQENLRGWSMKNRSKCNFFRYSCKLTRSPTYGQRSFWPNMTVLRSKMAEHNSGHDGGPVIISRKSKGVVHEKSVKMQLLQILLQINTQSHIWTEIILAKYERPHFKNGRAQLRARRRPSHYIKKI